MPDRWTNGLEEAVRRLREHVDGRPPVRFDARDKAALYFILTRLNELEARLGPKPWCPDCDHPVRAHHPIIGCQHLTPVYDEHRLLHHDKCRCKTGMPEKA